MTRLGNAAVAGPGETTTWHTRHLRKQHNDSVLVVREITVKLGAKPLDATGLRSLLSKLAGQVRFHLAMQDEPLCPRLASCADPAADRPDQRHRGRHGGGDAGARDAPAVGELASGCS